jgi:hypothetical protein
MRLQHHSYWISNDMPAYSNALSSEVTPKRTQPTDALFLTGKLRN